MNAQEQLSVEALIAIVALTGAVAFVAYLLLSVSVYVVFAPVYWYFLFRNLRRCAALEEDLADEQKTKGR